MNILEILIFLSVLTTLILRLFPDLNYRIKVFFAISSIILISANLIFSSYRWQMVPIYIFATALLILTLVQFNAKRNRRFVFNNGIVRKIAVILSFLLISGAFIFPLLLPVVDLPEPRGLYSVGTTSFQLVDSEREELFTANEDDARKILINAWYPADSKKTGKTATYWDSEGIIGKAYSINSGLGTFWYTHLSQVKTNSILDAEVSSMEGSYPVIIYSHSYYGLNRENTMLFEDLASNGYIVLSINHSYETIVSLYPDDQMVEGDLEHVFNTYNANEEDEKSLYEEFDSVKDYEKKKEIAEKILTVDESDSFMIGERSKDVISLLNELENMNSTEGTFKSKLDLDNIGMMGWSYGGASTIQAILSDDRIKAGVDIDGWPYGEKFGSGSEISKPFMIIRSAAEDDMEGITSSIMYERLQGPAYMVHIQNASHMNFWDFPLFFKAYKYFGYWDSIDPLRLRNIDSDYISGFFDTYLKGDKVDLDEISKIYPNTEIEYKNIK